MAAPLAPAATRAMRAVRVYAVGGALLFAVSLASGAWLYAALGRVPSVVAFVVPGPGPGSEPGPDSGGALTATASAAATGAGAVAGAIAINLLLFTGFAAHHSLLARSRAKIVLTAWLPPALERSTYVWVASLLFLLVTLAWRPIPGLAYAVNGWLAVPLVAIQLGGVLLTLLSAAVLDPRELAGLRQAWQYGTPEGTSLDRLDARPVTFTVRGAYGLVRHPIYLGWFMMVWAAPHMTWGRVTFAAVSSLYLLIAIPWEERTLVERHGDGYRRYAAQVRWRVLPGLY